MSSRQKVATALESLRVAGSAAGATTQPTSVRAIRERVVGATAIALAMSVVIQNAVVVWAGAPAFGDPIEEVLA